MFGKEKRSYPGGTMFFFLLTLSNFEKFITAKEVRNYIEKELGFKPSYGQTYTTLERLYKKGFVECSIQGSAPGDILIRTYKLTLKGKKELSTAVRHIQRLSPLLV